MVLTFYSYKGGTGRTMALANVGCLLARERAASNPVLMMDWDFEAPGLHSFFETRLSADTSEARERFQAAPGVLDLLVSVRDALNDAQLPRAEASDDDADEYVASLDLSSSILGTGVPNLWLMKAGRFDDDYAARVNSFDWEEFYRRVPWLFLALARRLESEYAYTLIDSRTGLTDTSGICTMLMPERLIVAFTPGRQSLTGLAGLIKRAIRYRRLSNDPRPLAVFPLPSRIENSEADLRKLWRTAPVGNGTLDIGYQPLFEQIFREAYDVESCPLETYFDAVTLQHEPRSAYGERIAVEDELSTDVLSLGASYRRFVDHLVELSNPWDDLQALRQQLQVTQLVEKADAFLQKSEPEPVRAEAVLTEAVDVLNATSSMKDPGVAEAFRRLAAHPTSDDQLRLRVLTRALELDQARIGPDHLKLIAPLRRLAELKRAVRDREGALQSATRASAIAEASFGPNDSKLADLLSLVADIRIDLKDVKGSEKARTRADEIRGGVRDLAAHAQSGTSPISVPRAYLDWLKGECASVELLGLRVKQGQAVRLNNVYVPLTTLAPADDEPRRSKARRELAREQEDPRTLLLSRLGRESLYVSGDPGSGKSTFCRWLAWLVCEGGVPSAEVEAPDEFRESLPSSLAGRLPLLVPLRAWWHCLPEQGAFSGSDLETMLTNWLDRRQSPGLSAELMAAHFKQGTVLLVLDGLDEVPADRRAALLNALADARPRWTDAGNRLFVTSRPYGLSANDLQHVGLSHAPIQPLPSDLQVLLARRWFRILQDNAARADATADDMRRQVQAQGWLAPLMENPLLLTAICIVFGEGRRLPEDKYELYDRVVDTVLYSRIAERPRQQLVRARLSVVAYGMHTGDGLDENRSTPQAEVTDREIDQMLRAYQKGSVWSERHDRSVEEDREELVGYTGLLLPREEHKAAFLHLSFQEFLSAQRLADVRSDRLRDAIVERSRVPEWRNTLSFVLGSVLATSTTPDRAVRLVSGLIERADDEIGTALVAADGCEVFSRRNIRLAPAVEDRLRQRLSAVMRGSARARDRCDAGAALGKIGDPRFRADAWFLPDEPLLGFVEVPAGSFTMGSDKKMDARVYDHELPQHLVTLPAFYIARWPVTVAQFRAFVEAPDNDGFVPGDMDCIRGVPNHPVVYVSWHETRAYSRWLTRKLRQWGETPEPLRKLLNATPGPEWSVTLPSEAEWEKAARGTDGRIYPWGAKPDPNLANYDDTGIGGTSAVGCFPGGASPCGAEELSGNMWEWTRSLWKKYPYAPGTSREDLAAPDEVTRVVRGGAFGGDDRSVRSAIRGNLTPADRYRYIGCRVVVSPFRS
jgi:formylglycine-generating enzyme required for sulfatase activity/cellulose biosynthesis protein BcsQ